jgi:hypothetical protein
MGSFNPLSSKASFCLEPKKKKKKGTIYFLLLNKSFNLINEITIQDHSQKKKKKKKNPRKIDRP